MKILIPIAVTPAMIVTGTSVAEPDVSAGEVNWISAGTYALGVERLSDGVVYACVQAHTGRATLPALDAAYWLAKRPSNRRAPFDYYTSTTASATASLTYVLQPGFVNGISLYGLTGSAISVTIKDAPGGSVIYSYSADLFAQAFGLYELLFTPLLTKDKLMLSDLPISPLAEISIGITSGVGEVVAVGMINVGDWRTVIGQSDWGGVEFGASADPKSYSYIKTQDDGTTTIKRRGKATDMRGTVAMPPDSANYAYQTIQQVLDIPVSIVATTALGYDYINVFGLISASLKADNAAKASLDFSVKGFI